MKTLSSLLVWAGLASAVFVLGSMLLYSAGRADIGWPPLNPAAADLSVPDNIDIQVAMISEEVNLTVEEHERPVPAGGEESPAYWMRGLVDASFLMRNLGQEQEAFDVWFPLAASMRYPGMLPYIPDNLVQDFKVWVNGEPVEVEQVIAPDLSDPEQDSPWARFPMVFPAGQDVNVRVSYTIYPSGRRPFGGFEYILQTGAGWKGPIGEAKITVNVPDIVTPESVSLSGTSIEGLPLRPNPAGYTIENNNIHWRLTDLEPTAEDNIFVDVLETGRYRSLVRARARAEQESTSADAQLELASAVEGAVMVVKSVGQHGGGKALAEQANAAYRRALELDPEEVEVYRRYASWLMRTGGWISLMRDGICPDELCALVQLGLEKFPNDSELVNLDAEIRMLQQEAAPYATQVALDRTATAQVSAQEETQPAPAQESPTAVPTQALPTETPAPTAARVPDTPAPIPTREPGSPAQPAERAEPPSGLCSSFLLPLGGLMVLLASRRLRR